MKAFLETLNLRLFLCVSTFTFCLLAFLWGSPYWLPSQPILATSSVTSTVCMSFTKSMNRLSRRAQHVYCCVFLCPVYPPLFLCTMTHDSRSWIFVKTNMSSPLHAKWGREQSLQIKRCKQTTFSQNMIRTVHPNDLKLGSKHTGTLWNTAAMFEEVPLNGS